MNWLWVPSGPLARSVQFNIPCERWLSWEVNTFMRQDRKWAASKVVQLLQWDFTFSSKCPSTNLCVLWPCGLARLQVVRQCPPALLKFLKEYATRWRFCVSAWPHALDVSLWNRMPWIHLKSFDNAIARGCQNDFVTLQLEIAVFAAFWRNPATSNAWKSWNEMEIAQLCRFLKWLDETEFEELWTLKHQTH